MADERANDWKVAPGDEINPDWLYTPAEIMTITCLTRDKYFGITDRHGFKGIDGEWPRIRGKAWLEFVAKHNVRLPKIELTLPDGTAVDPRKTYTKRELRELLGIGPTQLAHFRRAGLREDESGQNITGAAWIKFQSNPKNAFLIRDLPNKKYQKGEAIGEAEFVAAEKPSIIQKQITVATKTQTRQVAMVYTSGGIDPKIAYPLREFLTILNLSRQKVRTIADRARALGITLIRDAGVPVVLGQDYIDYCSKCDEYDRRRGPRKPKKQSADE